MSATTAKRGFHDPMQFVRGAADAPPAPPPAAAEPKRVSANEPLAQPKAPDPVKVPEPSALVAKPPVAVPPAPVATPVQKIPSRRAPPTRPANVRIPEALHEELRQFWKDTDIPMSEVIIEGTRQRLAELKKQYGME